MQQQTPQQETPPQEETPPSPPHQLRMGVAMSGAIALVLYESGVAHETLRFLRGWAERQDAQADPGGRLTAYGSAFTAVRIKPVVDILTGASAGGINSVLMANCIATDAVFDPFRAIWIETAGVDKLRYGKGVQPRSLLDTTPLIRQVGQQMLENVRQGSARWGRKQGDAEQEDLDVRLCRTDILGHCESTRDALHHQIDVDSKADVIRFTTGHFCNPAPDQIRKLLDAAAATSAFPGAFPPVQDENVWYSDGGLWDNQPVDLAVRSVADKPAFGVTHRCILFTDPDPSREDTGDGAHAAVPEPSFPEIAAQLPFMGLKGSLWPAIRNILDYNRRSLIYQHLVHDTEAALLKDFGKSLKCKALAELQIACPSCPDASTQEPGSGQGPGIGVVNQVRLQALLFDDDPALINRWNGVLEGLRIVDGQASASSDEAQALQAALGCLKEIGIYDLERRTRRRQLEQINTDQKNTDASATDKMTLYRRIGQITAYLQRDLDHAANPELRWRLGKDRSRFRDASERMLAALEARQAASRQADPPPETLAATLAATLTQWVKDVRAEAHGAMPLLATANDDARAAADPRPWSAASVERGFRRRHPSAQQGASFLHSVAQAMPLREIQSKDFDPPDIDIVRCVLAAVSDLVEKKPIDLIRISPNDTNNLHLVGGQHSMTQTDAFLKLAGEGLGHLSGFLEQRWRRNDYIWGRLDACEILLNTLCRYAPLAGQPPVSNDVYKAWLAEAQGEILREEAEAFDRKNTGLAGKVGSKIVPLKPGVVPQWTPEEKDEQEANRQLIGKGGETWQDADQPGFADNLHYLAKTAARLLQGDADKPPSALSYLERLARLNAYIVRALTWAVAPPGDRRSFRHFTVASVVLVACATAMFLWGWTIGHPTHALLLQSLTAGLLGAVFLVALGGVLGWRFGVALWAALGVGLIAGLSLPLGGREVQVNSVLGPLLEPLIQSAQAHPLTRWLAPPLLWAERTSLILAVLLLLSLPVVSLILASLNKMRWWARRAYPD